MAEAARRAGLPDRSRWNKVEKGLVPNLTLRSLEGIAKALGVKAADLLK